MSVPYKKYKNKIRIYQTIVVVLILSFIFILFQQNIIKLPSSEISIESITTNQEEFIDKNVLISGSVDQCPSVLKDNLVMACLKDSETGKKIAITGEGYKFKENLTIKGVLKAGDNGYYIQVIEIVNDEKATLKKDYCSENIIPDSVIVQETPNYPSKEKILAFHSSSKWKDGGKISFGGTTLLEPYCRRGSNEGQSINNFYCENLLYSNTQINNEGIVGETVSYEISLVLGGNTKIVGNVPYLGGGGADNLVAYPIIGYNCKKVK